MPAVGMQVGAADAGQADVEHELAVDPLGLDEFLDREPVPAVPNERLQ